MQIRYDFCRDWQFKPSFSPEDVQGDSQGPFVPVTLPHTVKELPYNCFSDKETAMISCYRKTFRLPDLQAGQRVILQFDGVMAFFRLFVNGKPAGEHAGGYSRARFDITPLVRSGEENTVVLQVDSTERPDIPPFGYTIDFLTFGGVYREAWLWITDQCWIEDVLFRYTMEEDGGVRLEPELYVDAGTDGFDGQAEICLADEQGTAVRYTRPVQAGPGRTQVQPAAEHLAAVHRWDIEDPHLYTATVTLTRDGAPVAQGCCTVGFRTIACRPEGFYLNGRMVKIMGLNRHQSFPYVGYAMPSRCQRRDAEILKEELHVNAVRTSHYMQSAAFLSRCDELGLLVFSEMPGWGHIGDEAFQKNALADVENMVLTQFNHPSIFIWSVRVNESGDNDGFYEKTNAIAHRLDPSRPTTGVRCIKKSHMLADVYTYNDFIHYTHNVKRYREVVLVNQQQVTGLPHKVPFLVSEYGGHVFPVKPGDCEERQMRHVLLHALVQSTSMLRRDSMGAIGWCAFDYNTHADYGSGDKICYHGVMDMFRVPKYAAYLYRSQVDPAREVVLEPATVFARGENDDNRPIPFAVLTNCDYIDVVAYGKVIGRYFPSLVYQGLPHPPIIVDEDPGRWQDTWEGGEVIGYIGGKEVARRTYAADAYLDRLDVRLDDTALYSDRYDATRVVCRFLDQQGNLLPFFRGAVFVHCTEGLQVIGPELVTAQAGTAAFWVRTLADDREGTAEITVSAPGTRLPDQTFALRLEREADRKRL